MMDEAWRDALEIVVGETRHERWRLLCSEDHPNHLGARKTVLRMAGFPIPDDESPTTEDLALRRFVGMKGCGGCGGPRA